MRPSRTNPVPSVVMNDGTPIVTVKNPFTQPTTSPSSSAKRIASSPGKP